jgi:hypothetical protein
MSTSSIKGRASNPIYIYSTLVHRTNEWWRWSVYIYFTPVHRTNDWGGDDKKTLDDDGLMSH